MKPIHDYRRLITSVLCNYLDPMISNCTVINPLIRPNLPLNYLKPVNHDRRLITSVLSNYLDPMITHNPFDEPTNHNLHLN
jgi:hypothetical protein